MRNRARVVLVSVLFAVLLPAVTHAAGMWGGAYADPGLSDVCSSHGLLPSQEGPAAPDVSAARPCLFCISSAPLFADALAPAVVAIVDGAPLSLGPPPTPNHAPDAAASRPVSPRAPPFPG